jgi:hypothetical protein
MNCRASDPPGPDPQAHACTHCALQTGCVSPAHFDASKLSFHGCRMRNSILVSIYYDGQFFTTATPTGQNPYQKHQSGDQSLSLQGNPRAAWTAYWDMLEEVERQMNDFCRGYLFPSFCSGCICDRYTYTPSDVIRRSRYLGSVEFNAADHNEDGLPLCMNGVQVQPQPEWCRLSVPWGTFVACRSRWTACICRKADIITVKLTPSVTGLCVNSQAPWRRRIAVELPVPSAPPASDTEEGVVATK